ncbi:MAG: V-type ATP synthase subunit E [Chlamydiae bacterium]|nr:V-type ATP synthase subunit E [Chlamydiota bacterium]
MEIVDSGKDKVKKICDALKKQTLDPAKLEAKTIVDNALKEAEKIVKRAKEEAKEVYEDNKKKLEQEKKAFRSSLHLAATQTLEVLKQEIENNLFDKPVGALFKEATLKEEVVAQFINIIVSLLKEKGLDANLLAFVPQKLSKPKVLESLTKEVLASLPEHAVHLSEMTGGAKIKLKEKNLVLEITDTSLKELFSQFLRDDFREVLFGNKV